MAKLVHETVSSVEISKAVSVCHLAVVVLVAAVEASLVRVAQVAPLQVNMHFAQSESKDIINSAWHFFPVKMLFHREILL